MRLKGTWGTVGFGQVPLIQDAGNGAGGDVQQPVANQGHRAPSRGAVKVVGLLRLFALWCSLATLATGLEAAGTKVGITADDASRAEGTPNPVFTFSFAGTGASRVVSGAPSLSTTATQSSPVGTYPINISLGTLVLQPLFTAQFTNGTLTVTGRPPVLVLLPTAATNTVGGTANFSATADGTAPLNYQWLFKGNPIPDQTNNTLSLAGLKTAQGGAYSLAITNAYGAVTSAPVELVVQKKLLTVTARDAIRPRHTENPVFTASYQGFVNGDTERVLTGAPAFRTTGDLTTEPGHYPIYVTAGTLASDDYNFTFLNGNLTVTGDPIGIYAWTNLVGQPPGVEFVRTFYDGPGPLAKFQRPTGLAVDPVTGVVYVADAWNRVIRKVAPDGTTTTIAGAPSVNPDPAGLVDGPGQSARFGVPWSICRDQWGNLFVADYGVIRKLTPSGDDWIVSSIAGKKGDPATYYADGVGFADGPGEDARFYANSYGIAVDNQGNVFASDWLNGSIRRISPVGTNWVVTTVAGRRPSNYSSPQTIVAGYLDVPMGLAVDSTGNIFIAGGYSRSVHQLAPGPNGYTFSTLAGGLGVTGYADGPGASARFDQPWNIVVMQDGSLLVSDNYNYCIRKLARNGSDWVVSSVAGTGGAYGSLDGIGAAARFGGCEGLAMDDAGNVYVGDYGNPIGVRKLTPGPQGYVASHLAGATSPTLPAAVDGPAGVARLSGPIAVLHLPDDSVLIGDDASIKRATPNGDVTTIIGGSSDFAIAGTFFRMADGTVYFTDLLGAVRKLSQTGTNWTVNTIAGALFDSGSVDGDGATARFATPWGLTDDGSGGLLVSDYGNHTVRWLTPIGGGGWNVSTIVGKAGTPGSVNGTNGATRLNAPTSICRAQDGTFYLAESGARVIRKLVHSGTNWILSTFAGGGLGQGLPSEGFGSGVLFGDYLTLKADAGGNLFILDIYTHTVLRSSPGAVIRTIGGYRGFWEYGFYGNPSFTEGIGAASGFYYPFALDVDEQGNVYVGDKGRVTKASPLSAVVHHPRSQPGYLGRDLTLTVTANGGPGLGYQWRKGGTAIPGANTTSLTLSALTAGDAGNFDVVVTGPAGSDTSDAAAVSVVPLPVASVVSFGPAGSSPVSSTDLTWSVTFNTAVPTVNASAFSLSASGTLSGAVIGTPTTVDSKTWLVPVHVDAGEGTLVLSLANAGGLYAQLTDTLPVNGGSIAVDLAAPTVAIGTPSVPKTEAGPVTYAVTLSDAHLQSSALSPSNVTLLATGTAAADVLVSGSGSNYTVTLSNVVGVGTLAISVGGGVAVDLFGHISAATATSQAVDVGPLPHPPALVQLPIGATNTVGGSVSFGATASGTQPLSYQWLFNGTPISGQTNTTLTLAGLKTAKGGAYSLAVANAYGSVTSAPVNLVVQKKLLTVTALNAIRPRHTANPVFTAIYQGFVNGDAEGVLTGAPAFRTTGDLTTEPGHYTIYVTVGTLASDDYSFTFLNGNLTVTGDPIGIYAWTNMVGKAPGVEFVRTFYDGPGPLAQFARPTGLAVDPVTGVVYVADVWNRVIRRVDPDGTTTTIAGAPSVNPDPAGMVDGPGLTARFGTPWSICRDKWGNLYVGDSSCVRKLTPAGGDWIVSTIAGKKGDPALYYRDADGFSDGLGEDARFFTSAYGLYGIAADDTGNVFVSDWINQSIRKVSPAGTNWLVTTIAGAIPTNFSSSIPVAVIPLYNPMGLAVDATGNIFIAGGYDRCVHQLTPGANGYTDSILAGAWGVQGYVDGPGASARFDQPWSIVVMPDGNLLVADDWGSTVRKLTRTGTNWVVSTVAGSGGTYRDHAGGYDYGEYGDLDGIGTDARFGSCEGLAMDNAGNVYVGDYGDSTGVRKLTPSAKGYVVSHLAGAKYPTYPAAADGPAGIARLTNPISIIHLPDDSTLFGDGYSNFTIKRASPEGDVVTVIGSPSSNASIDGVGASGGANATAMVRMPDGTIYFADYPSAIRKLTQNGTNWTVTTVAGALGVTGSVDGDGATARFNGVMGLTDDGNGGFLTCESDNHTVRWLTPKGGGGWNVSTIVGKAGTPGDVNGTNGVTRISGPTSICRAPDGTFYLADIGAHVIRKLVHSGPNWVLSTFAGGGSTYEGIGTSVRFSDSFSLALKADAGGNLLILDQSSHILLRSSPAAAIRIIGGFKGWYSYGFYGDPSFTEGIGGAAGLAWPTDLDVDSQGNIFVADTSNTRILKGTPLSAVVHHPRSQSGYLGLDLTLSVTVNGGPGLGYQWRKGGVAIPGADAAALTLPALTAGDAGNYDVVVTGPAGSDTSDAAAVSVVPLPVASVVSFGPAGSSPVSSTDLTWSVTFNTAVPMVNASAFSLSASGTLSGAVIGTPTTVDSKTWLVPVHVDAGEGTLQLNLANAAGLYAQLTDVLPLNGGGYVVDLAPPVVVIGAPSVVMTEAGPVTFPVTLSDPHLQGSSLCPSAVTLVTSGTADADVQVSGSGGIYTVTLANVTGVGSLAISIGDGVGVDSLGHASLATLPSATVAVGPMNHPPVAAADTVVRDVGRPGKVPVMSLLTNDSDPDAGDTLSVVEEVTTSANGVMVVIQDGWVQYMSDAGTPNTSDTFQYRLRDNHGAEVTGMVTINVRDRAGLPPNAAVISVTPANPASNRNLTVKLQVLRGRTYYVYGRDSLTSGVWVRLNNGNPIVATTSNITLLDPNRSNSATRLYRVEVVTP